MDTPGVLKVYTGQGSVSRGMGADILKAYPQVRKLYNAAKEITGLDVERMCREGTDEEQTDTKNQQAMVYVNIAALILRTEGLLFEKNQLWRCPEYEEYKDSRQTYYLGFSLGEILALLAARKFSFVDGLKLIKTRSELMAKNKGEMASTFGATIKDIESAIAGKGVYVAIVASSQNISLGGKYAKTICKELEARKIIKKAAPIKTSAAFHTPLFEQEGRELEEFLREHSYIFMPSDKVVISSLDGQPFTGNVDDMINRISQQICNTVHFGRAVKYVEDCIEEVHVIGPGAEKIEKIVKTNVPGVPVSTIESLESLNKYWENQMKRLLTQ